MKLTPLLTPHAIVQRNQPIPIWGWTDLPRTRIRAYLGTSEAEGVSGDDARFLLRLPALPAGGPHTLVVERLDGDERLEVPDVLVGDVWLASGQSNMQWSMSASDYTDEIAAAKPDQIRMITIANRADAAPQSTVKGEWRLATPDTMSEFSAVANFFAQRLQDEIGIPCGIISASWGGTFIETWISRERLLLNCDTRDWVRNYESFANSKAGWDKRSLEEILPADPGNRGVERGWHTATYDDRSWETMPLPGIWQQHGHNYSAVMWFRTRVKLPPSLRGKPLTLHLGAVDKQDITYVNGVEIGRTGSGFDESVWAQHRKYTIPSELTQGAELVIAVRAYSFRFSGGLTGPASAMRLVATENAEETSIPLAGDWRWQVEHNFGLIAVSESMGHGQPNSPYILFENMIRPLLPVGIAGAIWYQGESNAPKAPKYRQLLRDLIEDWRFHFGLGNFPFGIVQLTSYMAPQNYQPDSNWALLREAQQDALEVPDTGLTIIHDVGDAADIHPKDKRTVGIRLAQWALAKVYGRAIVPGGPIYRENRLEGSRIRILFDQVGDGLALRDGDTVQTLVIAGADGVFLPAQSIIEGESLLVWHPDITAPLAVRYAWADNPEGANLVNTIGYPAGPFRTDRSSANDLLGNPRSSVAVEKNG
jgi:sialate O-acetylesterase